MNAVFVKQFTDRKMDIDEILDVGIVFRKDCRDIKRAIALDVSLKPTHVYIVAVHKSEEENELLLVKCHGVPLTTDVYDSVRDGFIIRGISIFEVGSVPVGYKLQIDNLDFEVDIPLPMSVIRRYMTEEDKQALTTWKSRFDDKCNFVIVQTSEVYE